MMELSLADESATLLAGENLGKLMREGGTVYLHGPLGAGKTTLCKGVIASFGYSGLVKSPTYTLVEVYQFAGKNIYHFDLYRLGEPEELEFMGIRDYFSEQSICLVEWPERGGDYLAQADLIATILPRGSGRVLQLSADSARGKTMLRGGWEI